MIEPTRDDYWRLDGGGAEAFKEWQHFIVLADGLELLVNFNVALGRQERDRIARVIVLARDSRFVAAIDRFALGECLLSRDGRRVRFGGHALTLDEDGWRVALSSPRQGLSAELTFTPRTTPLIARNQQVAAERRLHWTVYARCAVSGVVELGGRRVVLDEAPAYHDHNWGHFAWGDDFAWEWGVALPRGGGAAVYSALMNSARTTVTMEQLFVWQGGACALAASGDALTVETRGCFRPLDPLRVPAPMALVHGGRDGDLPRELEVTARDGADWTTLRFVPRAAAQLLVPSERTPLGAVVIHECIGAVRLDGSIAGAPFACEGPGVFEFVRR